MLKQLDDIQIIDFPRHGAPGHDLRVFQADDGPVPFAILRVFTVQGGNGESRGRHAHKACNQLMVCLTGGCEVMCSDGRASKTFCLDASSGGLWVPPGIWAEQTYLGEASLLMVLCDRPYEVNDYIRDFQAYQAYRANHAG
jgi:dTDP-4-dehydrorhamnose 3,5-epimerase-like enzyme